MDLQPHIEAFIEYAEGLGRSPQTLERHRTALGLFCRYLGESGVADALAALTPQVMAGFQSWLYQARSRYGRPYQLKSQIITLNSIQVFGRFLAASGRLLQNPAEAIRLPREPKRLPGTILTPAEMKKLLAQPDTATVLGFRDRTFYEVLYSTGLRIMEAIRLRVPDVNFDQRTLFVHAGKGGKDRVAPLGATACRYLAEYLRRVRPVLLRGLASLREASSDTVFLDRLGHPFDKSGILKKLAIYATRAGIKKHITVHTFRHTLATEMLRHGADLRQIQELLGHANLRTTQIYTHIVKGELKRVQEQCHPREQTQLPEGFVRYRGRKFLTDDERHKDRRSKTP
jgi:integrase/recombinase XerD